MSDRIRLVDYGQRVEVWAVEVSGRYGIETLLGQLGRFRSTMPGYEVLPAEYLEVGEPMLGKPIGRYATLLEAADALVAHQKR